MAWNSKIDPSKSYHHLWLHVKWLLAQQRQVKYNTGMQMRHAMGILSFYYSVTNKARKKRFQPYVPFLF